MINNRSDETVDEMPEDKFHLRLPSNVDQYTGSIL
jgi:hypothetical protein